MTEMLQQIASHHHRVDDRTPALIEADDEWIRNQGRIEYAKFALSWLSRNNSSIFVVADVYDLANEQYVGELPSRFVKCETPRECHRRAYEYHSATGSKPAIFDGLKLGEVAT